MKKSLYFVFALLILSALNGCSKDQAILEVVAPQYSETYWLNFNGKHLSVKYNGKWGVISSNGNTIIPPLYSGIDADFSEGLIRVYNNGKFGFISTTGKLVIRPQYQYALQLKEGLIAVKVNRKWGYINTANKFLIKPQYEDATNFLNGYSAIKIKGSWGLINKASRVIIQATYDTGQLNAVFHQSPQFIVFSKKANTGSRLMTITKAGKTLAIHPAVTDIWYQPLQLSIKYQLYTQAKQFNPIFDKRHFGCIDSDGSILLTPEHEKPVTSRIRDRNLCTFVNGLAIFSRNNLTGFINKKSIITIKPKYDYAYYFNQGLAPVAMRAKKLAVQTLKYGHIDKTGQLIIPLMYEYTRVFSDGLAAVKINGKWGYINKKNTMLIPAKFDNAAIFYKGYAITQKKGYRGIIDRSGKYILPPLYKSVLRVSKNNPTLFQVHSEQGFRIFDANTNTFISKYYDQIYGFKNHYSVVKKNGLFGIIKITE